MKLQICTFLAAASLAGLAQAQGDTTLSAADRYKQDRAACMNGSSNQSRQDCLKEAGAAYELARHGGLVKSPGADYAANARKRCEALSGDERTACIARMGGQGSTSGTVGEGGIYRELTTVTPAPRAAQP